MVETSKRPRLVGNFIRQRRETLGLSQRALGLLFTPPVTTQFISNVERGVTPLPPAHVTTLTKALQVSETEFMALLEQEYAHKLSGRLGAVGGPASPSGDGSNPMAFSVSEPDYAFMRNLYEAFSKADSETRRVFAQFCERTLNVAIAKLLASRPPGDDTSSSQPTGPA